MADWFYPGQEDYITKLNELGAIAELLSGPDGWSPVLAVVSDSNRRVFQVTDWVGGETTKPTTGQYVGSTGFVSDIALAVDIRGPQGITGNDGNTGPANALSIGTVTSGATADATITGTSPTQTLNLVLPKGDQGLPGTNGVDGSAATITVGTVTTGAPGSSATVTNVGTTSAAVFDFSIPRGADGSGSGDVIGSASSTTNNVALFADTSGKLLKDGGTLGTAAFSASTAFATAAQGTLASTAVQPGTLSTVATTGSYNDLSSKPTIPAAQVNTDWTATSGVAQILNKPTVVAAGATQADARATIGAGTSNLVLGTTTGTALAGDTEFKTVNGLSVKGSGDIEVGYRNIPQNIQSSAYTLSLSDSGKHILHPGADTTARTFTIPANSAVAFPVGTAITFVNQNSAGVVTIAITTDVMRLAGAGTTGTRTLARNGVATAVKITATEWIISGSGLT